MKLFSLVLVTCALLFSSISFSDPLPQASGLSAIDSTVSAATTITTDSFISTAVQIATQIKGSVPVGFKIAGIVLLLIAFTKVSFIQPLWAKLGSFQAFAAPLLGLIVGLLLFGYSGTSLSLATVMAYLGSGAGAIALHEILDAIKGIPGLGSVYVSIITTIESVLGGGSTSTS